MIATPPSQFAALLPLIGFELTAIEYGSLDLSLEIAGIRELVKLFDGNLDVFMLFLQGYLPIAFDATLMSLALNAQGLRFEAFPTAALAATFSSSAASSISLTDASASGLASAAGTTLANLSERSRLIIWLVTNSTLIVPALIALGLVYVGMKGVAEERTELRAVWRDMAVRDQDLQKRHAERITELERSQLELLKLILAKTPAPTPVKTK